MTRKKTAFLIVAGLVALCVIGTAIRLSLGSRSGHCEPEGSKTPLGGLLGRANAVSRLKERMGDLRAVYPAMMAFAAAHEDELPRSLAELRPHLPPKLADL